MAKSKSDAQLDIQGIGKDQAKQLDKSQPQPLVKKIQILLQKFQILNFMLVGGIGYALNMLVYWPLTLVFKNNVSFLG